MGWGVEGIERFLRSMVGGDWASSVLFVCVGNVFVTWIF